ncbi:MAG: oligopeptide transport system ATP-binding protein [Chloroflexota bacterium]|nr:oligopeptide transport system ATP-binding protein [Chloroflexota bacterium]
MDPLLDVRNLRTQFPTGDGIVHAVNGVSFTVMPGEAVGLVGESGCGKSISALSIMGLVPRPGEVVDGQVLFEGRDLRKLNEDQMRRIRGNEIAVVFQDPMTSLNPVLTVRTQVTEPLMLHKGMDQSTADKRAVELLELVEIPAARTRLREYPHQFSGGMRQRVMIAMALACEPKLLIADEPTTALDVTIQAQILELMTKLRKEVGMALIMITHDLGVVAGLCDRINVMYAGYIVEHAPTEELFANPRHPYTLGLLRSIPRMDVESKTKLIPIEGFPPDLIRIGHECPFQARCVYAVDKSFEENPTLQPVGNDHLVACWVDVYAGRN